MTAETYQAAEMLPAGLPPAHDRMLTTCFVAALFHGIVILGVTFSSSNGKSGGSDAPALEVILVNDQAPSVASNPNAQYLSERSQRGSGNTLKRERALVPKSSLMSVERPGIPSGGFLVQAPLWAAVGLPVEGLGILIAVDAVPDMFKGALNVAGYLSAATLAAGSQPGDAGPSVGS